MAEITQEDCDTLLTTVKTFLFDVDEALERETDDQKLVMTAFMWLQIEALRALVQKIDESDDNETAQETLF